MTYFRPRRMVLFVGDIIAFILALWLSLTLRGLTPPSAAYFEAHLYPFSLLFVAWVAVFFIAGLYESGSIILARRALSATLLIAQVINLSIAALFFFFVPLFLIAPKALLFIYLPVSFAIVLIWRVSLYPLLGLQKQEPAVVVGEGQEVDRLIEAMQSAHRAPVRVAEILRPGADLSKKIIAAMDAHRARIVVADFSDSTVSGAFPQMYNLISVGVRFFDALTLYEEMFGRIPLSILNTEWLARNISRYAHTFYDTMKRLMDVLIALPAGIISLIFYPCIALAIKIEDGGDVFVLLPRVGQDGATIFIRKFRSMTGNDQGRYGSTGTTALTVTKVGNFLRRTRLDELPQLFDIVAGRLSLIGPRPETPALVAIYEKEIPYYGVRHLIKPGLSGWAQLYHHGDPHHATDVQETMAKLSYDLYYLKHRSLLLDLTIALKTIRRVLVRGNA